MPIENASAVLFCNVRARRLAADIRRVYTSLGLFIQEFDAKGMADLIPGDSSVVQDGSPFDGRTPITGADVNTLRQLALDLVAMAQGPGGKMGTVLKVAPFQDE